MLIRRPTPVLDPAAASAESIDLPAGVEWVTDASAGLSLRGGAADAGELVQKAGVAAWLILVVYLGQPLIGIWGSIGVACVGVAAWGFARRRHMTSDGPRQRAMTLRVKAAAVLHTNARDRLRCHGAAEDVGAMLALGPIRDSTFEPAVFYLPCASSSHRIRNRMRIWMLIGGVALLLALDWLNLMPQNVFSGRTGLVWVTPWLLLLVGMPALMSGWLLPTYVRMVPGRLDIMECGWLGRSIRSVTKLDLRTSAVVICMFDNGVRVGEGEEAQTVAFGITHRRYEFVRMVLLGALSTAETPALPDDALVG